MKRIYQDTGSLGLRPARLGLEAETRGIPLLGYSVKGLELKIGALQTATLQTESPRTLGPLTLDALTSEMCAAYARKSRLRGERAAEAHTRAAYAAMASDWELLARRLAQSRVVLK